jgi:hypothetical protein
MTYVIAGFGKFGRIALERIVNAFPQPRIVIVESRADAHLSEHSDNVRLIRAEVVAFLNESSDVHPDDIIVPMVPFHLLGAYVMATHPGSRELPLPEALEQMLPNPFRLDGATLACSRADFMCPDDCPEGERCTVTGERRESLYNAIEQLRVPGFTMLAQRSFQILPGVGGYPMKQLKELASKVMEGHYLLATSCKCHAVVTALEA